MKLRRVCEVEIAKGGMYATVTMHIDGATATVLRDTLGLPSTALRPPPRARDPKTGRFIRRITFSVAPT